MALILDNKKSQVGSPYGWYSVYAEEVSGSRTSSSVKVKSTSISLDKSVNVASPTA